MDEENEEKCGGETSSVVGHEELHRRKSYGKETWRVNKISQETVMITN